ncbi:MAG: hypothetical protein KF845_14230 [Cyclobacteriaceae bacterium]|nr:hypothetical protein [Cyclobacteriaceae bacterium]
MKKENIILALTILLFISAFGQQEKDPELLQTARFEKEHKFSDNDFTIISLKEDGLALTRGSNKYKSGSHSWELIILDNNLKEKHTLTVDVDQRKNIIGYEHTPGYLYLMFKPNDNQKVTLDLFSIRLSDGATERHEIETELTLQLTHFIKVSDNIIVGGYVNTEPAVLLYNLTEKNTKVLPGFFQKQTELVDLRPNQNNTFNIILVDRSERDQRKLVFKTFDATGKELLQDISPVEENFFIQTGISSSLIREDLRIFGTWGSRNSKQSLGFYSIAVDPFNDQKLNLVAFGELNHYLDYQNEKRAAKIKERTQSLLKQNRLPDFMNYVMPYKVEELPTGFVLFAETYNPSNTVNRYPANSPYGFTPYPYYSPFWGYYPGTYNRMYNPYYYGYGNNMRTTNDEIKAVQSVVVAVNNQGKVLWDYSLKLEEMRSGALEQVADCYIDNQEIYMLYKKESDLIGKIITLDDGDAEDIKEKISVLAEGDEIRSENKAVGQVRHWYGKNFYVWGQHSVGNRAKRSEGNRQVFYINKVSIP